MSDVMRVQPFEVLLGWILREFENRQSVFGIHRSLFSIPGADAPYRTSIFGHPLTSPIGPGAGPHTQLAQNIICAWLSGARFIELKTVQIMDELDIPRPCIDMEDEGYNVEWSQELKLEESAEEYVKAWVLIRVLRRVLGLEDSGPFGTVFNMSVGYNMEGIQRPRMIRFMERMADATEEIAAIRATLKAKFPQFADIEVPPHITDNVTLSTMHGCPPDEIEQIGKYLLEERGLHTTVKLNPTLLGKDEVMAILHDRLGFREIAIPDRVFEHDLQYGRAVALIRTLQDVAARRGLSFGVKLSNTLAMANHRDALPGDEMYMSGRALYPITINLFHKLVQEFDGDLNVSFSAGADALNATDILAAGALPLTAVTDLLKPGGYSRLVQYLESLERDMQERGATTLEELAADRLANLERAAGHALEDPRYKKSYHPHGLPKVDTGLEPFDCIAAPCVAQCAVCQDVPEYAALIARGEVDRALEVILSRNPLPGVTGYVCTHLCQTRCTRNNYEEPVAIRALKRFAQERGAFRPAAVPRSDYRVAIVGSGPSGLAAAYFLALNGVGATIYEARERPGGMLAIAPTFRLPEEVVQADIDRVTALGVEIKLSQPVTLPPETLLAEGFDAVYVASGMQQDARLGIAGEDGQGVHHGLDLLNRVRRGERVELGRRVLVIGGGNSAMDATRTALRLTGAQVTIVYRRTRAEMPADVEEIEDALLEGADLMELVSPVRLILRQGRVAALECIRNELGEPGRDGRRRPVPVPGSEFQLEADAVVVAIGQAPDLTFLDGSAVSQRDRRTIDVAPETGRTTQDHVYAGGDAVRGPASIVEACADGRRAAEAICAQLGVPFERPSVDLPTLDEEDILQAKRARARKLPQNEAGALAVTQRGGFDLVEFTLTEEAAQSEAARCVQCATFCDKCVEVCPNRANYSYTLAPLELTLPVFSAQDDLLVVAGEEHFRIEQARQIIHVDDFCNECGNCATFCVHQGKPYLEKPRLFLTEQGFLAEADNAFFIRRDPDGWTILHREDGRQTSLSLTGAEGVAQFESEHLRVAIAPGFESYEAGLVAPFEGTLSLREAAEMVAILHGVTGSLPFLPFPGRE